MSLATRAFRSSGILRSTVLHQYQGSLIINQRCNLSTLQKLSSSSSASAQQLNDGEFLKSSDKWSKHSLPKELPEQQESIIEAPKKEPVKKRKRRQLKPLKSVITLTPNALHHLSALMNQPDPKLIRISVSNRGCSGLTYQLEYVSKPEKFDECVEQDGVKVLIDSKALFSIIGSEMDWIDDKLSSKFVFKNPNSKGTCGCGESFMV